MSKFINIETERYPYIGMLVDTSRIILKAFKYNEQEYVRYEVCLPDPLIPDKELKMIISESTYSKLYGILCEEITNNPHYPVYIPDEEERRREYER